VPPLYLAITVRVALRRCAVNASLQQRPPPTAHAAIRASGRHASLRRESGQLRGPFTGHAEWKSKRIIAVNVQGITRKKKDFTSLPLAKIQAFSVETAGTFDLDAELELWFSGLGKVKFEFSGKTDVAYLNKLVAHHVL
jgi:Bacterial PH domain